MDQSIGLNLADRRRAIETWSRFVTVNDAARAGEVHSTTWSSTALSDDVYNAMLAAMPVAADYRPMSGRSKATTWRTEPTPG